MSRLSKAGLFKEKPEDGGGTWGVVARLNDTGLAVRTYLMEQDDALPAPPLSQE